MYQKIKNLLNRKKLKQKAMRREIIKIIYHYYSKKAEESLTYEQIENMNLRDYAYIGYKYAQYVDNIDIKFKKDITEIDILTKRPGMLIGRKGELTNGLSISLFTRVLGKLHTQPKINYIENEPFKDMYDHSYDK